MVIWCTLPEKWLTKFLHYLIRLQTDSRMELLYGLFVALKSWMRFNISLPEGIILDEYGMLYPNIKTQSK